MTELRQQCRLEVTSLREDIHSMLSSLMPQLRKIVIQGDEAHGVESAKSNPGGIASLVSWCSLMKQREKAVGVWMPLCH